MTDEQEIWVVESWYEGRTTLDKAYTNKNDAIEHMIEEANEFHDYIREDETTIKLGDASFLEVESVMLE